MHAITKNITTIVMSVIILIISTRMQLFFYCLVKIFLGSKYSSVLFRQQMA